MKTQFSRIALSLALISSMNVLAITAPAATAETHNILFSNFAPDDVRVATVTPAVIGAIIAAACTLGKGKAVETPYLGDGLKWAAAALEVSPTDLIEGVGLFVGVNGLLGLWTNGPEHRDDFAKGAAVMLAKGRFLNPGKIEQHEVRDAILRGGLAGIFAMPFFKNDLPQILGLVLPERFKKAQK